MGEHLRVLVLGINYTPEPTGIAPYTAGLAEGLAAAGHTVRVITGFPHYPAWERDPSVTGLRRRRTVNGVDVVRVAHPVPKIPTLPRRVLMESVFSLHALTVRRFRPDVVLAVSPALLSVAAALTWRRRGRTALGVITQDLYGRAAAETGLLGSRAAAVVGAAERALLARADGVAVIHTGFAATLEAGGLEPSRIRVLRNWSHIGAPSTPREQVRAARGWGPSTTVALHAGNMGTKQGLETVVEAAREADRTGADVRFVLLGDGSRRAELEVAGRGVRSLEFLAPRPDGEFEDVLAAADVLVLNDKPGVVEMSVPSKLTTYFKAGRPLVCATHPGSAAATETASSGAGVCTTPGDHREMLATVRELGADVARCTELGARGRAYAERVLGAQAAVGAYERWVRDLAAGVRTTTPRSGTAVVPTQRIAAPTSAHSPQRASAEPH